MLAALLANLPEVVPNLSKPGGAGHVVGGGYRQVSTLNLKFGDLPTDNDYDEELCILLMRSKL